MNRIYFMKNLFSIKKCEGRGKMVRSSKQSTVETFSFLVREGKTAVAFRSIRCQAKFQDNKKYQSRRTKNWVALGHIETQWVCSIMEFRGMGHCVVETQR